MRDKEGTQSHLNHCHHDRSVLCVMRQKYTKKEREKTSASAVRVATHSRVLICLLIWPSPRCSPMTQRFIEAAWNKVASHFSLPNYFILTAAEGPHEWIQTVDV
jgi:hypothetical protein